MEPTRKYNVNHTTTVQCYNLADELRENKMHRVDYMTIDTEGSEIEIVEDFPWHQFECDSPRGGSDPRPQQRGATLRWEARARSHSRAPLRFAGSRAHDPS